MAERVRDCISILSFHRTANHDAIVDNQVFFFLYLTACESIAWFWTCWSMLMYSYVHASRRNGVVIVNLSVIDSNAAYNRIKNA